MTQLTQAVTRFTLFSLFTLAALLWLLGRKRSRRAEAVIHGLARKLNSTEMG